MTVADRVMRDRRFFMGGANGENRENREDRINWINGTNEINEINGKVPIKRSVTHHSHQVQRPHLSHQAQRYPSFTSSAAPPFIPSSAAPPFIPTPAHLIQRTISCQKGSDLAYRKSECPRIVQIVQPRVLSFWDRSKMTPYHKKYNNLRRRFVYP